MQLRQNSDIRRLPTEKGKGLAGTAIFHGILLLLLIFVAFTLPVPPETEEGILVNFGTDETGSGFIEPSSPAVAQEAAPPPANVPDVVQTEDEPLLTQEDEEAPEVKKVDPEAEKRRLEKIETDRKLREQLEADRIRKAAEEAERKKIEADKQRATDISNKTKNALANSKNAGTSSTSEGVTGGTGNQGSPTGSVNSNVRGDGSGLGDKGISYDLGGRGFQKLPAPKYDYQEGGKVVVEVYVDRKGKVVKAVAGTKGSTILDDYLLRVAREAALAAQFQENQNAPEVQRGTITYNFILK